MSGLDSIRQLRGKHVAWAVLSAMLLSSLLHLPRRLETLLPPALDLAAQWQSPAAQIEAAVDAPHQVFWQADSVLPRDVVVLLTTAAWDPALDEALLWRARYVLTPRRVEPFVLTGEPGLDPTASDQLAFDLAVLERARQLGASHLLTIDPAPHPSARGAMSLDGGSLVSMTGELEVAPMARPEAPKPSWPIYLAAAIAVAMLLGDATAKLLRGGDRRLGHWAAAWVLGAALLAWAMLLLSLGGVALEFQVPALALGATGLVVLGYRAGASTPTPPPPLSPATTATSAGTGAKAGRKWWALLGGLVAVTLGHGALVALLAMGHPWSNAESWSRWGLAGRAIFRRGGLGTDPIELDLALGLPLCQAWISAWLGQPDERLLGCLALLSWLALLALLGSTVQRFGGSRPLAWMVAATVASSSHLWSLAGSGTPDLLLASLAAVATLAALRWQLDPRRSNLLLCAVAVGLLPTLSTAGTTLAIAIILALVITRHKSQRAASSLALVAAGLAIFAGPGWWLQAHLDGYSGLSGSPAGTAGEVLAAAARLLLAPGSAAVWILLLQVVLWRAWSRYPERRYNVLPVAAGCYLGLVVASYLWRPPTAGQAELLLWRHSAHVLPLAMLWLALHAAERRDETSATDKRQQFRSTQNATSRYNFTSKE